MFRPDGSDVVISGRFRACWLYAAAVVAADQLTKAAAGQVDSSVIAGARNPSYAMGVVGGPATVLVFGTLVVLAVFVALIGRWALQLGISPLIPALVTGGMVGNVLDRVRLGSVRDFIVTPWVICNFADLAIAAGILALGVAFGWRFHQLRAEAATVRLARPGLRAIVVTR